MAACARMALSLIHIYALHGTTTLLPTSLASGDEALLDMIHAYQDAVRAPWVGAAMPGLHLEGPYFSLAQAGAQAPDAITPPDPERTARILKAAQGSILRCLLYTSRCV